MRLAPESPLRCWINRLRRWLWHALAYRMLFGERATALPLVAANNTTVPDATSTSTTAPGAMAPHRGSTQLAATRIAPSTCLEGQAGLRLADYIFIGQFNFLEASAGMVIEEGVQITNFCSLVTHSTHRSIRLMGRLSAAASGERIGDIRAPIHIGAYSYIGPHSLVEAGTRLGRGSLVAAYSRVRGEHPPFAVLAGNPAQVVGDTRERDAPWLQRHPELQPAYSAWAGALPAGVLDDGVDEGRVDEGPEGNPGATLRSPR